MKRSHSDERCRAFSWLAELFRIIDCCVSSILEASDSSGLPDLSLARHPLSPTEKILNHFDYSPRVPHEPLDCCLSLDIHLQLWGVSVSPRKSILVLGAKKEKVAQVRRASEILRIRRKLDAEMKKWVTSRISLLETCAWIVFGCFWMFLEDCGFSSFFKNMFLFLSVCWDLILLPWRWLRATIFSKCVLFESI